jgi:glutaconate CoA-transferase, subunit A
MTAAFVAARRDLEESGRALRDNRATLTEAAALVPDGAHVAIGGCLYSRTPNALLFEVLRQRRQGLELSRSLTFTEGELFLVSGAADKLVTSWMGLGARWGTSKILRLVVEGGHAEYEEWSHLGLGLRYRAAAMGVPFLPTLTMLGSDLANHVGVQEITCPFTGARLCAVPALFPDVALLHVHRADPHGNAQIDGYAHMDVDIARAARTVIVTAEQVVDPDEIAATADRTLIPHFAVDAVVEVPFGAYPHECYGLYDADFTHVDAYVDEVKTRGMDGVHAYLERYVYGARDVAELIDGLDPSRKEALRRRGKELVP